VCSPFARHPRGVFVPPGVPRASARARLAPTPLGRPRREDGTAPPGRPGAGTLDSWCLSVERTRTGRRVVSEATSNARSKSSLFYRNLYFACVNASQARLAWSLARGAPHRSGPPEGAERRRRDRGLNRLAPGRSATATEIREKETRGACGSLFLKVRTSSLREAAVEEPLEWKGSRMHPLLEMFIARKRPARIPKVPTKKVQTQTPHTS